MAAHWLCRSAARLSAGSLLTLTCLLTTAARAADPPTFVKDVAPILWKNCAGCHRPGEIGPFSLLSYEDAQKRADFLAEITKDRRMPPWKPEPGFGKFQDERRLTDAEIDVLVKWAAAGAPQGDPEQLPKPPEFPDGWQLGEPDLVLKMKQPFDIPADGPDVYRCFVIPIPIDKDAMVSAVEFRPGNRAVVHHSILFLDANGKARKKDGQDGQPGYQSFGGPGIVPTGGLGGWAPGATPRYLPEGVVRYLRNGSDLVMQLHYHPTGKPETDQSVVGLYFSKKPARKIATGIAVVQPGLHLQAGNAHCEVTAQSSPIPADVHLLGITPHMHNLGKAFKVTAVDPSGTKTAPLIWIKDWDFNWQGAYQFVRPIRLPKGSRIKVEAVYDNSAENTKNPNSPPKDVTWGEQTSDEMCLCSVQVFTDTIPDLRKVATMAAHELGIGIEGGVPETADAARKSAAKRQVAARAKAAKKSAADEPMPVAQSEPAAEPPADAAPVTAAEAPARKKAKPVIPDGGIVLPEKIRPLAGRFDLDNNGVLTREEIDKLPPETRDVLVENLLKAQPKAD